jgi:predicted MFS family arabinose efflux permease
MGLFSVMPVLARLLDAQAPGAGPAAVGAGLFGYTALSGIGSLLVNRWLSRFRYTTALGGSTLLAAAGFGLLPYGHGPVLPALLLVVAGLGNSVHFQLVRVIVAELIGDDAGRNRVYSLLNIAVNIAATAGPFIAGLLYPHADARPLLALVTVCYLAAAAVVLRFVPRQARPRPAPAWPISRAAAKAVLRDPATARLPLVIALGSFGYGQFYSAFALLVAHSFGAPLLRSLLLAGPAVAIVALQSALSDAVGRLLSRGTAAFTLLCGATLLFGASMLALALGLPVLPAACAAVVLFSVAEMVFTPMASTACAVLPVSSPLEGFNFRQVSWTLGESLGSLCGGGVFLALYTSGDGRVYWAVVAALLVGGAAALWALGARRSAPPAQQPT